MSPNEVAGICVVVFSDMQFDQAQDDAEGDSLHWETLHERIVRKWIQAGFSSAPSIVYWNLKSGR